MSPQSSRNLRHPAFPPQWDVILHLWSVRVSAAHFRSLRSVGYDALSVCVAHALLRLLATCTSAYIFPLALALLPLKLPKLYCFVAALFSTDDLTIHRSGAFSNVYQAIDLRSGQKVAGKADELYLLDPMDPHSS